MVKKIQLATRPALAAAFALLTAAAAAQSAPPVITSFSPTSGVPGTLVTITGSGFGSNLTSVKMNGVTVAFYTTSVTEAKAYVASAVTTGPITCSGPLGSATSAQNFTVIGGATTGGSSTGSTTGGSTGGSTTGGSTTGGGGSSVIDPPPHITPPSTALTTHPRMWVRQSDLTRLRSWAVPGNPIWIDLQKVANGRKADMINGKIPQMDSGDGEGNGIAYPVEEAAELFAFMSLVDPVAANRADWSKRAHDLMMYMMNQAVLGPAAGQKYRSPHFATFNRSRWYGEAFPLVMDWCYDTFTAAEKATVRKVFIRWSQEILNYNITGNGYTLTPAGVVNSPSLTNGKQVRWAANNYWCNHARNIGMMSIALDAADDIPATTNDYKSGYLRDYIGNAIGGWMYVRNYAETHDLAGGISPEGPSYSESSFSGLSMLLLALHTAGYDSPATYGAAAGMANNSFWKDDITKAYLHSLSPQTSRFYSYAPLIYQPAGFGDVLHFETVDMIRAFGPLAVMDLADGNTSSPRLNDIRWIQTWTSPGGPSNLDNRLINSVNAYGTMLPIMYFLTFDPSAPTPTDPRVGMSTNYIAAGLNRILSRTDWGTQASWFSFISTWNSVDHQWGNSNSFSLYGNGEPITKEWSGYGKNVGSTDFQNNISIENPVGPNALSYIALEANHGSQFSYMSDGDPVVKNSMGTDYVFAEGDVTKRFNSTSQQATDVQHASRSILWLKPSIAVVYDRADSKSANRYKRFHLNFATQPAINGNVATIVTPKGQNVVVTSLLPAAGSLTWDKPSTNWGWEESTAEEPMHYRLISEDLSKPQSVRFLNVINYGASAAASKIVATGTAYDGAAIGNLAVLFAKNLGQAFTGLVYTAPAGTTNHFVTGLVPGSTYKVVKDNTSAGVKVTITASGSVVADAGGVIRF